MKRVSPLGRSPMIWHLMLEYATPRALLSLRTVTSLMTVRRQFYVIGSWLRGRPHENQFIHLANRAGITPPPGSLCECFIEEDREVRNMAANTVLNYLPRESVVHRLTGTTKLAFFLVIYLRQHASPTTPGCFGTLAVSISAFKLSKDRFKEVRFMMIFMLVFIAEQPVHLPV